jgi:hypothetical protein
MFHTPHSCDDYDLVQLTLVTLALESVRTSQLYVMITLFVPLKNVMKLFVMIMMSALQIIDYNACTNDSCDSDSGCDAPGCVHKTINCDDYDSCTDDSCNPASGCVNVPVNCDDNNACTEDFCDGVCQHVYINCDDYNACTIDDCR